MEFTITSGGLQPTESAPINVSAVVLSAPLFSLTVPANAFRSNFAGVYGDTLNPYIAAITFTIAKHTVRATQLLNLRCCRKGGSSI